MHFVSICKIINYNLYNIIMDIISCWPSQPKWCWVVLVGYSLDLPNSPGMVMRDDVSLSTNPSPVPQIRLISCLSLVSRCSGASTSVVFPPRVIPESCESSAARLLISVPHNEVIILPFEDDEIKASCKLPVPPPAPLIPSWVLDDLPPAHPQDDDDVAAVPEPDPVHGPPGTVCGPGTCR